MKININISYAKEFYVDNHKIHILGNLYDYNGNEIDESGFIKLLKLDFFLFC